MDYGARPGTSDTDPTGATDIGAALQAAIDAFPNTPATATTAGVVFIPQGSWYQSTPVLVPSGSEIVGAGEQGTRIFGSIGNSTNSFIPGFAGPMLMLAPRGQYSNAYGAALVGTGRSLTITSSTTIILHDALPWRNMNGMSSFSIQMWVNPTSSAVPGTVISSAGAPDGDLSSTLQGQCFALELQDSGGLAFFRWTLKTTGGSVNVVSPTGMTYGTSHNLEINYNGSFVDVYQDGINVGHTALTGTLVQQPWEGVTIGTGCTIGPETTFSLNPSSLQLDSVRFSNTTRHTGTGSFTPPSTRYAWDANTLALYNWDQGDPVNKPWIIGQVQNPTGGTTPLLHYMRCYPVTNVGGINKTYSKVSNLALFGLLAGNSGIIVSNLSQHQIDRVWVGRTGKFAIAVLDGGSFFGSISNSYALGGDVGFQGNGGIYNNIQSTGSIGVIVNPGYYFACHTLDAATCIFPYVLVGPGDIFSSTMLFGCSNDNESASATLRAAVVVTNRTAQAKFLGCSFNTSQSTFASTVPAVICNGTPYSVDFDSCKFFVVNAGSPQYIQKGGYGTFNGNVRVTNVQNTVPSIPFSSTSGFVATDDANRRANVLSISGTDTVGNNLRGQVTVSGAATTGTNTFGTAEPDANYNVTLTPVSSTGTPAAGSNRVLSVSKSGASFTVTVEAAPGVGNTVVFDWKLVR